MKQAQSPFFILADVHQTFTQHLHEIVLYFFHFLILLLRACLNFPLLDLYSASFEPLSVSIPGIIRHIARYVPQYSGKISLETALKIKLSKI